jgi:hypothetical protein
MSKDPWTDPDPQPGDFDAELTDLDPRCVEHHEGDRNASLAILVPVEREVAERLERMAVARGKSPGDLVAELLRDADPSGE